MFSSVAFNFGRLLSLFFFSIWLYLSLFNQSSSGNIVGVNVIFMDTNNDITKTTKLKYLKCLREIIPNHVNSGIWIHSYLLLSNPISEIIISYIDVANPLATWSSFIILQFDSALNILINKIVMDLVSLFFQDVSGPYYLSQNIVHSKNLNLSWTLSVKFLFSGFNIGLSGSHGH